MSVTLLIPTVLDLMLPSVVNGMRDMAASGSSRAAHSADPALTTTKLQWLETWQVLSIQYTRLRMDGRKSENGWKKEEKNAEKTKRQDNKTPCEALYLLS